VKEDPEDEDPLQLKDFIDKIDSWTGFIQQIITTTPHLQLELESAKSTTKFEIQEWRQLALQSNYLVEARVFLSMIADQEEDALEEDSINVCIYDDQRRSSIAKEQDKW
jgi:hypothetical protein